MRPIYGIVAVRTGSSRLPGKVLADLCGKPALERLLERFRLAKPLDGIVVATTQESGDDAIERLCLKLGIRCFRGSTQDVSSRVIGALESVQAKSAVMVYGDGPFVDPDLITEFVRRYEEHSAEGGIDFLGNDLITTYPAGLEVEVFSLQALKLAVSDVTDPQMREHATLALRQNKSKRFRVLNVEASGEYAHPEISLEIDEPEDLEVVRSVFSHLYAVHPEFKSSEAIRYLLSRPDLSSKTAVIERRWKSFRNPGQS